MNTARVAAGICGNDIVWASAGFAPSARAIGPRSESRTRADTAQMKNWKNETAPAPKILPSMSWNGRTDDASTSMMRVVFSSSTELITLTPYSRMAMNSRIAMKYAVRNDCVAFSETVRPCVIFFCSNAIRICAQSTTTGFTPLCSSRAFTTSRPSVRCRASIVCMPRLDAWYSARPVSTRSFVTIKSPFSCFASTSSFSESMTRSPAGASEARNALLAFNASTTRAPNPPVVLSTTATFRTAPPSDCTIWNTMIPANNTGPRIAETQNHLVRTRSTNSRRMTAQTLCIRPTVFGARADRSGSRGFGPNQIHEDLME